MGTDMDLETAEEDKDYEPEDLGLLVGTKDEAFWNDVKEKTEHQIEDLEKMLKFNKGILELCATKLQNLK